MRLEAKLAILTLALVGCNAPPTEPVVHITPEAPTTLDDLVVEMPTASTDDNKKDVVSYTYEWSVDGEPMGALSADTVDHSITAKGQVWEVRVTPTDGKEPGPPATASVTVVDTPPTVEVQITPAAPSTADEITVSVETEDVDNDDVEVLYAWSVDGETTELNTASVPADWTAKDQVWTVTVTPVERLDQLAGAPVSASVSIVNTPPEVESAWLDPQEIYEETVVSCVGEGWFDLDGDPENYEVEWLVDGVSVSGEPTLSGDLFDKGQTVQCRLTPVDGDRGATVVSPIRTVRDSAPVVPSVSLTPEDPQEGDVIEVTVDGAYDPDGDDFTLFYQWYRNEHALAAATGATLSSDFFDKGDSVYVEVWGEDASGAGEVTASDPVLAINTPPVIDSLDYETKPVTSSDDLVLVIHTSDADEDRVRTDIEWYVDGAVVAVTDSTLTNDYYERDSVIYAIVTASDDEEEGASKTSTSITVQNSPPLPPTLAFDPEEPSEDDDLICTIDTDSTDQDGDDVSYTFTWEVDGVAYTDAEDTYETGDTVPSIDTAADEVWTCTVTPNDGTEDGASVSESVTITPDEEVYYISYSDLVGLSSTCGTTTNQHMYNGCAQDWGVSWTDTGSSTPVSITLDWNVGIDCIGSTETRTASLNSSSVGSWTLDFPGNCDCDADPYGPHEESATFTSLSSYNVGGYNEFTISYSSCEGLSTNSSWGGYYAIVTVEY